MKIFKSKIIAVVLTLAMVLSVLAVPVVAAEEVTAPAQVQPATAQEAADFLAAKDLLQGDNGDLMLDKELTREQMIVILSRLMGEEETAISYPTDNMTFTDVPAEDEYAPYIAWAQETGITQGYDEETFGFGESLTAWQTKAFFVRALGFIETADEEIIAKADELKISTGSTVEDTTKITRADMALLMSNTVYATNSEGKKLGEVIGVLTPEVVVPPVVVPVTASEVKEAKVIAEDAIKVTFDAAADTTAAKFEVTGAMIVVPTVTWNEAKTEATLKSAGIFLDGTYTVKVTGITLTAGKDSATVIVAKNGVAKIEILGDKLVRTGNDTGIVSIKLTDFYGTDVTEKMAYDVDIKSSRTADSLGVTDAKKGIVTLDANAPWSNFPVTPELVTLTVYSKTAVNGTVATANAVLKVTDLARVDKVELSQPVLPTGATKVILAKTEAAYLVVTAKDQFGYDVTDINDKLSLTSADTEIFYSVSDSTIKDNKLTLVKETTSDGKEEVRLKLSTAGLDTTYANRKVTFQVISKYTASASNVVTVELKQGKAPYRVTLGAPEKLVAVGDSFDETLIIPMNVYDEDGVALTADEIADKAASILPSGDSSTFGLAVKTSGQYKGKLVGNAVPATTGIRSIIVSIANSTTAPATMTVDVKDRAKARTLKLKQTPASNLLYNSITKYSYDIIDQYGRVMEDEMLNYDADGADGIENDEYTKVKLTLSDDAKATATTVDDADVFAGAADGDTDAENIPEASLTVKATALNGADAIVITALTSAGSVSVKAELQEYGTANVISTDSRSFSVTEGVPASLTFEIADAGNVYAYPAGAQDMENAYNSAVAGDAYAKALTITAKDANGNSYAVPYDRILSVATSNGDALDIAKVATGSADILAHQNKVVVWSNDATAFPAGETATTKKATITVTIGTDTVPQPITKEITVAKEAPKAQQVLFLDTNVNGTKPYELPSAYDEVKEIVGTAAQLTDDDAARVFYIVTKDQYGVYTNPATPVFSVVNIDKTAVRTIGVDAQNTLDETSAKIFSATNTFATANVILMYTIDGVFNTLNVKATNGVADGGTLTTEATAPTVAGANTKMLSDTTFQIKFSEAVNITAANLSDVKIDADGAGGGAAVAKAISSISGSGTDTITVTIPAVAGYGVATVGTVDISAAIADLAGNTITAVDDQAIAVE